jgi:hypothetical protein
VQEMFLSNEKCSLAIRVQSMCHGKNVPVSCVNSNRHMKTYVRCIVVGDGNSP